MTIHAQDIKLRASRVMADVPEGGGGPSPAEIGFGESNTVFDDIDSISRTMGNVSIRQVHMHVDTPDTDKLLGAYAVIAKLPTDPNVSVTLATCDPFAVRSQISQAIANYLIKGVPWNGFLLGNHVQGQANLQIFQRPGTAVPTIGRTLVLVVDEGKPTERTEWVRVIKVDQALQTFTDMSSGQPVDYQALVVKCDLQSGLTQALPGTDPNRAFTRAATGTLVRDTTEADAANYYGAARLAAAGHLNDLTLKVASVFSQLVPSSTTSVPALDQRPAAQRVIHLADAPRSIDVPATPHSQRVKISQENRGLSYVFQLTPLPVAETIVITWVALGNRQTVQCSATGELSGQGAGIVNLNTGSLALTLPSLPDVGSAIVVSWGEQIAFTNRSGQGALMRVPEYAFQLPQKGYVRGSLVITWTSGGVVKTASANTAGIISGDAAGTIDAPSGAIYLQPTAMIDAGGQFQLAYNTVDVVEETLAVPTLDAGGFATLALAQQPAAGTLQVTWKTSQEVSNTSGGSLAAASANKSADNLTFFFAPYYTNQGPSGSTTRAKTSDSGNTSTTSSTQDSSNRVITTHTAADDGAGNLIGNLGSVNYSGKSVNLRFVTQGASATSYKSDYQNAAEFEQTIAGGTQGGSGSGTQTTMEGGSYGTTAIAEEVLASSTVNVRYIVGSPAPAAQTATVTPPPIYIDVCPYTTDRIVANSLQFTWMGHTYIDVDGVLYRDRTGGAAGVASGTVDYIAGLVAFTDYAVGASPQTVTLQSLWTQKSDWKTASLFFMSSASPIQPGQITITVQDTAGALITVACDLNGNLTGPHATGKFEFQNGLGELQFGDYVDDASLTAADKAEWWYSPADVGAVQAGKIWRPWPVDPASLRYNAVSNFYLPVDPSILGLDPVRLPQDGKVPIFKKGRIVIIGSNKQLAPRTYAAGDVIDCGRTRLSHVWLIGADGKLVTSGFSADGSDLDAGQIHVDDVTGWAQPVTVEHRVQDMVQCTDVQIDGTLGLNIPLSHEYDTDSVVSSAILFGDTFARAANMFDQQTWDGVTWADAPSGNVAVGTYNDTAYPVVVTNTGALSDRYALRLRSDATTFDFISQNMGTLGSGTINADYAPNSPVYPSTPTPIFRIKAAGWGGSWVAGNTVFLKLQAAMQSMALIRTVQPGTPTGLDYSFDLLTGGDIDRPPSAP